MKISWLVALLAFGLSASGADEVPLAQQMQIAVLIKKDTAEVRRVLDAGFDVNGSIGCGHWPAILGAAGNGDLEMTSLLLDRGSKVPDEAMTYACRSYTPNLNLIKLLVAHGGNVNAREDSYSTCLHWAITREQQPLVEYLISCPGIDLNIELLQSLQGETPLMLALSKGTKGTLIARKLIEAGANTQATTSTGRNAASIIHSQIAELETLLQRIEQPVSLSTSPATE